MTQQRLLYIKTIISHIIDESELTNQDVYLIYVLTTSLNQSRQLNELARQQMLPITQIVTKINNSIQLAKQCPSGFPPTPLPANETT